MRRSLTSGASPVRTPSRIRGLLRAVSTPLAAMGSCAAVAVDQAEVAAVPPSTLGVASSLQSQALTHTASALAFVVLLIVGGAWLMRRVGRFHRSADGVMKIVSVLSLGSRERVVLLQVGRTHQVLVGVAPGRVSALRDFRDGVELEEPVGGDTHGAGRFGAAMKALRATAAAPTMRPQR